MSIAPLVNNIMLGYECLVSNSPRSFLFSVVANVGPRGASRSLAVAYRQGNDRDASASSRARVENVVADTLSHGGCWTLLEFRLGLCLN
jgi:hypothetical protein